MRRPSPQGPSLEGSNRDERYEDAFSRHSLQFTSLMAWKQKLYVNSKAAAANLDISAFTAKLSGLRCQLVEDLELS
jgi:hypothetical protein